MKNQALNVKEKQKRHVSVVVSFLLLSQKALKKSPQIIQSEGFVF